MNKEKKTNVGLVVLICLLFVVVVAMGVIMVYQNMQSKDTLLIEAGIEELETKVKPELTVIYEEKISNVLKERDLTEEEIKEIAAEIKEVYIRNVKEIKHFDKDFSTKLIKRIDEFSFEATVKESIEQEKVIKKAREAVNKATVANITSELTLTYAEALATGTASQMTKEDYISVLKKSGYSDDEIALVDFTVNEEGAIVYNKGN